MKAAIPQQHPLAIAMWDFSWLERRWPGAGYEDWNQALAELVERGYNAVRIDAYPHLLAADAEGGWVLVPCWSTNDWGSPGRIRVRIWPRLCEFLEACAAHGVRVGLSSWFREDVTRRRHQILNTRQFAGIWLQTLDRIREAGLLETVCYVDLCNEWPARAWAPFFQNDPAGADWRTRRSVDWMKESAAAVRARYSHQPVTFSFSGSYTAEDATDYSALDFLKIHFWVASMCQSDFYQRINYNYEAFDLKGYENLVLHAEKLYRADEAHWRGILEKGIDRMAAFSLHARLPLAITECWAVVDYKDWPALEWGWVKELCALGTERAAAHGRWIAIATSNFCGLQFRGMWRDVDWHQRLTRTIRTAKVDGELAGVCARMQNLKP